MKILPFRGAFCFILSLLMFFSGGLKPSFGRDQADVPGVNREIAWKDIANSLARELVKNLRHPFPQKILVASLVEVDNLSRSSSLGRILAELLVEELHHLGFMIYEPRLTRDLIVRKDGEFILSRKVQDLYREIGAQAAVTGLIGRKGSHLVVQVRMISLADSRILAVASMEFVNFDDPSPSVFDYL